MEWLAPLHAGWDVAAAPDVDPAAVLASALLPGTASCVVVVTSRDSLAGLVARHGATRVDLDLLPLKDAVALLGALIGKRVGAEPDAAAVLAGQCARLPLALRMAAELMPGVTRAPRSAPSFLVLPVPAG